MVLCTEFRPAWVSVWTVKNLRFCSWDRGQSLARVNFPGVRTGHSVIWLTQKVHRLGVILTCPWRPTSTSYAGWRDTPSGVLKNLKDSWTQPPARQLSMHLSLLARTWTIVSWQVWRRLWWPIPSLVKILLPGLIFAFRLQITPLLRWGSFTGRRLCNRLCSNRCCTSAGHWVGAFCSTKSP